MTFPFTYTPWRGFGLLIGCWLFGHAVVAQTLSLEDEQGKPVVHATLYNLYNQEVRTLSDSSGHASLSGFRATDTLAISHVLYHPVRITKQALANQQYRLVLEHKLQRLQQFVLVASKTKEAVSEVPYRVSTITAEDIAFDNPQTTADALQSRGDVLIQKSQMGGGSPILRGFEANRVLIVVDGVRMNNAIYRSGHLQNAITVDNAIMERMEVQFGPSSVMYGSDALGGVMHLYTKQPALASKDSTAIHYNAYTRYSSANNENTAHVDVNIGQRQWAFLSSVTVSRFGDLRAGANRSDDYPDFGKVPFFADRIEGADTMILNSNQNIQRETGYDQIDLLQKIRFQPNEKLNLQLNTQFSTSSDIPRFDRLNDIRDGELRFAEWYYGPQNRLMVALNAELNSSTKWFDDARATLAFQRIDESRVTRRFGQDEQTTRQEDVYVYTLNLDFQKALDTLQRLQYGLEVTHNDVHSEAYEMNINTRERQPASTRYPDGGSYMQSGAVYLSYKRFIGDKIVAHAGGRASYVRLESTFEDTTFYRLPFESIGFNTGALTGSLGAVYTPTEQWHVSAVLSSGYRVPNVDDVGKIFDNGTNVVVPNDGIRPEFAYNAEAAVTRRFWNDRVTLSGNAFVTFLRQVIVRREHQLNGQDSLVYEGELLNIQTNVNASRGTIWGYSLSGKVALLKSLILQGSFNYTYGEDRKDDVPLGHIPPTFGRIALNYRSGKLQASAYVFYNGWKRIEDMSPSGVDNEDEATADGFPSWYTLNVNTSYAVTPNISVQAALENILDVHYRPFASGLSAAGRNFRFTLRARI